MRWVGCRICMKFFNVWIACFVQTLTKGQSDELNITPPPPLNKRTATLRCSAVRLTWKTVTRRTKDLTSRGLLLPPVASNRVSHNAKGDTTKTSSPPSSLPPLSLPPPLSLSSETNHWCSNSFWRDSFLGKWCILQMFSGSLLCRWGQVMVLQVHPPLPPCTV